MVVWQPTEEGWIPVPTTNAQEKRAREMRTSRDRIYRNIFGESSTDERWVGELGEIVFELWLEARGIRGCQWADDVGAGRPDFVTPNGLRVGVKTVKRKGAPQRGYTAQITARHIDEPVDYFFFMSLEAANRVMWLLGGIAKEHFVKRARYHGPGEWVHANYQVRPGHEIYNIEITRLTLPGDWIELIT